MIEKLHGEPTNQPVIDANARHEYSAGVRKRVGAAQAERARHEEGKKKAAKQIEEGLRGSLGTPKIALESLLEEKQ